MSSHNFTLKIELWWFSWKMDDRELKMLMRSLMQKVHDNTPCSAEEEDTFTALFSSGVNLLPFISSPTTATLDDPHSSSSLMSFPYSDLTYDSLNATASTAALLRLPKIEPVSNFQDYFQSDPTTNFNKSFRCPQFYNNPPDLNLNFVMPPPPSAHSFTNPSATYHDGASDSNDYSSIFHHLPELVSLDPFTSSMSPHSSSASASSKRPRLLPSHHHYSTSSAVQFFPPPPPHFQTFSTSHVSPAPSSYAPPPLPLKTKKRATPPQPSSILARQRRQKLSDKIQCLQRLLPWDKKMDMATVFEEATKYVKFLQAQLAALQSMPVITATAPPPATATIDFGGLERLSRNQLLQVLLSSSVSQTVMYSQGCCVFSAEQLAELSHATRSSRAGRNLFHHPYHHFSI